MIFVIESRQNSGLYNRCFAKTLTSAVIESRQNSGLYNSLNNSDRETLVIESRQNSGLYNYMSKNLIRKPFSGLFAEKLWSFCHLFNAIIRISEPKNSLIFRDCVVYWHFYYISVFCVCQQFYHEFFRRVPRRQIEWKSRFVRKKLQPEF